MHTLSQQVPNGTGMTVAALFVREDSVYHKLGCDCYGIERNALTWPGGSPGVFHPPCRAWGNYATWAKPRQGEKELALWAMDKVRQFGGVLEHPIASKLWAAAGCGSLGVRDRFGGVLLPVLQCWWGHRALKKTGLYVVGPVPELPWADPVASSTIENMGRAERERTPVDLAKWLVEVAMECR